MVRVSMLMGGIFLSLAGSAALADSYMEHTLLMSQAPARTWTSGLMQRKEYEMPFVGKQIVITRVDKGVEWTLGPKTKTYEETPIALPYQPSGRTSGASHEENTSDASEGEACTPELKKLPGARPLAGLSATGYRMGCRETPRDGMIVWLAPSSKTTNKIQRDLAQFDKAYSKAQFANYPAKARGEMEQGTMMWQRLVGDLLPLQTGMGKMPEGMLLAMEAESQEDGKAAFYEVIRFSAAPVPVSLFEIPAGYAKADGKQSFGNVGGAVNMEGLMDALKGLIPPN